jgi:hypothetical protein
MISARRRAWAHEADLSAPVHDLNGAVGKLRIGGLPTSEFGRRAGDVEGAIQCVTSSVFFPIAKSGSCMSRHGIGVRLREFVRDYGAVFEIR